MNKKNIKRKRLFIGLISGTSMDGIDAALVDLSTNSLIAGITYKYSVQLKNYLNKIINNEYKDLKNYNQLNKLLGHAFANAALALMDAVQVNATQIEAIGSHGQTISHDTSGDYPLTLQLGCAHIIAERTKITVVSDFRTRDLIVGGQGAPLAPFFHKIIFKHCAQPLAIVNIGGIANLTIIADGKLAGYDLGPGNCLIDAWVKKHCQKDYDYNGNWASQGKLIPSLLASLLTDKYFSDQAPKSSSTEYFSLNWLMQHLATTKYNAPDVGATLLMLTAMAITRAIKVEGLTLKTLLVCGGGVHNGALMRLLSTELLPIKVASTMLYNISPDFIEAMLFAWLAKQALATTPLDLSSVTGAYNKAVLGVIYPAGI